MKKRADPEKPAQLWLNTFSDLMNLLLCFFVLLFAMSNVDQEKFQELSASLSAAFNVLPSGGSAINNDGILVGSGASQLNDLSTFYNNMGLNNDGNMSQDIQNAYDEIEKEGLEQSESMAQEIKDKLTASGVADQIEVTAYSKYVMLNVNGGILFDSGKAELTPQALTLLDKVADALIEYDDNVITIEGHTDNVPINTSRYPNNMMLSLYRAYSVFDFFVSDKGFSDKTMSSSGRGDAVPIADNGTPEGRAQNRRVEIKVYNAINS